MARHKTLRLTKPELRILIDGVAAYYDAGSYEPDQFNQIKLLLARLRTHHGDLEYDERIAAARNQPTS